MVWSKVEPLAHFVQRVPFHYAHKGLGLSLGVSLMQ